MFREIKKIRKAEVGILSHLYIPQHSESSFTRSRRSLAEHFAAVGHVSSLHTAQENFNVAMLL